LLEKATRRLSTDLPRAEYEEIKECGNELDAMSPTLARTVLDQADRLEAITRDLADRDRAHEGDTIAAAESIDRLGTRATLAESALAEARQKLAEIGEIAGNCQYTDGKGHLQTSLDRIANLAKDKTHG
jgi:hypothetical protein